jgi:hypothetical protein
MMCKPGELDLCVLDRIHSAVKLIRHVAWMGEERGVYKVLVGKPEGKRSLGRPRHRWEDTIRLVLRDVGYGLDWAGSG